MRILGALLFLLAPYSALAQSQDQIEFKVRSDLESMLGKIVEPGEYALQVSAAVEKVFERQLVEGEQITQHAAVATPINVPPLPGFDPPPLAPAAENPPGQTRQTFRAVERPVLRGLAVNLLLDQALPERTAKTVEDTTRSYLNNGYPGLAKLNLSRATLRQKEGGMFASPLARFEPAWLLALGAIALLGFLLYRSSFKLKRYEAANLPMPAPYRSVLPHEPAESEVREAELGFPPPSRLSLPPSFSAPGEKTRDRSAFAGVPTNAQYADHRRQLLDVFLKNASEFRLYFHKLDPMARAELCSALSGPAFSTLMESLKLEAGDLSTTSPPSEEQLQFYIKNFSEFHEALRWQEQQFFGFLPHLTEEQLMALVNSQSPVVGALILKFAQADVSASVLEKMNEAERGQIIDQFDRTREMSPSDLREIEQTVRASVRTLPNFILGTRSQELEYWTRLLATLPDPQKLLLSLERVRPDLYEKLAKFRFKLEDIPSLPTALLRKVMDDFENDDLARALSHQPPALVSYTLEELPDARRRLIQSHMLSYQNVENSEVQKSVDRLTKRLREVLA